MPWGVQVRLILEEVTTSCTFVVGRIRTLCVRDLPIVFGIRTLLDSVFFILVTVIRTLLYGLTIRIRICKCVDTRAETHTGCQINSRSLIRLCAGMGRICGDSGSMSGR